MSDDRDQALGEVIDDSLIVIMAERAGIRSGPSRDALALACLRLVNIICELPDSERPDGWEPDPGARTA